MPKTWECGKCGRNNPPHRRMCQTWDCCERGPAHEDKSQQGYWIVVVDASPTMRHVRAARGRHHQQQGQSSRKPPSMQSSFADAVAAAKLHAQLGQDAVDVPMMENGPGRGPTGGSHAGRGGRRGRVPDAAGQKRDAQAGPTSALGPQTAQDQAQSGSGGPREGKQEVQGVSRGRGVRRGAAHGQAEVDPAGEGCQGREGKGAGGWGGRGEDREGRQRARVGGT